MAEATQPKSTLGALMTFGKYKGVPWSQVPNEYKVWMVAKKIEPPVDKLGDIKCIHCGNGLRAFTATTDWGKRRSHKSCWLEDKKYPALG
jgi:uncharacterized protein (DUF3820 family)